MTGSRPNVREAGPDELAAVMNVLDGAALAADAATVAERIPGTVLVAVEEDRVLGACVVETPAENPGEKPDGEGASTGAHVEAIAVRPGRRGQGVGTALIRAATGRWGTLTATFDGRVRPFYESLGFDVEPTGDGRFRGIRPDEGVERLPRREDHR